MDDLKKIKDLIKALDISSVDLEKVLDKSNDVLEQFEKLPNTDNLKEIIEGFNALQILLENKSKEMVSDSDIILI